MTLQTELLEALKSKLDAAECPALLMVTAHLTGDPSVLKPEWRPSLASLPLGNYSAEASAEIRAFCLARLESGHIEPALVSSRPDPAVFKAIVQWSLGDFTDDEFAMIEDMLQLDGEDTRAPQWSAEKSARSAVSDVAVIGSGLSGLLAGLRLKQAGVPFVIYERGDELGGTWYFNNYPNCRIDVPSHIYTYSFDPYDWSSHFSLQSVMEQYLNEFADKNGLREHIRFNTEVVSAVWNAETATWTLSLRDDQGTEDKQHSSVISAVGQLNKPAIPSIRGSETFEGPQFHSAEWNHDVDFTGKRVAVIGSGASALQFGPAVAQVAEHVTVFQRTPPWLLDSPHLRQDFSDDERWLFLNLPHYRAWYRLSIFIPKVHGQLAEATVDPDYPPTEFAISAANDALRQMFTEYLENQIENDEWLRPHVVPDYPPGAKRIIRDDGTWMKMLRSENVSLVAGGIKEIVPDGIITEDGKHVPLDVILYGTGFKASDFLLPMSVKGENGVEIQDVWDGNAAAYMGVTVPGFPNFFIMYGPNTGVVVHANLVFFMECQANYIMEALRFAAENKLEAVSLKPDVYAQYCQEINDANALRAWGWSGVSSWYKNDLGRSPIMWPFSTSDYWARTKTFTPEHYELKALSQSL